MSRTTSYSPEVHERALRTALEHHVDGMGGEVGNDPSGTKSCRSSCTPDAEVEIQRIGSDHEESLERLVPEADWMVRSGRRIWSA